MTTHRWQVKGYQGTVREALLLIGSDMREDILRIADGITGGEEPDEDDLWSALKVWQKRFQPTAAEKRAMRNTQGWSLIF